MFSKEDYDITPTTFSPDGRIFQVEYAREAIRKGSLAVGFRFSDSVVLASLRPGEGKLVEKEFVRKQYVISRKIAAVTSGLMADGRILVDILRERAAEEEYIYGEEPLVSSVVKWLCRICELYTRYDGIRPFGAALLIGGYDINGPHLYEVDPSGVGRETKAWAIGRGAEEVVSIMKDPGEISDVNREIRRIFKNVYEKGVVDVIEIGEEGVRRPREIEFSGGRK